MDNCGQEINLLFETSWEVCNKIGGIYTVLSTKAKTLKSQFKDKLIFIGPDVWFAENPCPVFTEDEGRLRRMLEGVMLPDGVDARIGRWNIPGNPVAILVNFNGMYASKDQAYARMWELYGVDSLHAYGDYDEGCAFARAAAAVIEGIVAATKTDPRTVIAHFDEWTTAMGLLTVRDRMPEVTTVFTTHATSIGRSICGNGKPLYDQLNNYDGDQMASELNMQSKHSREKAAAWQADCFTTVSDVTAREAAQLLGKKPDAVTPNGFEPNFVPTKKDMPEARENARKAILNTAEALTGHKMPADTFIVATSGRCEYRNKGIDMFLDSISSLRDNASRTILALVLVPSWSKDARADLRQNLEDKNLHRLSDPFITHTLNNYNEDPIINRIHQLGFKNDGSDKVFVIYMPCYLNGRDGILNLSYYSMLPGLDATVFASYYEPWGYTPLESIAFGVPTITTSLAGFGAWVEETIPYPDFGKCGVEVAARTDGNYSEACAQISRDIAALSDASPKDSAAYGRNASKLAQQARWSVFIKYYDQAYCDALSARDARTLK